MSYVSISFKKNTMYEFVDHIIKILRTVHSFDQKIIFSYNIFPSMYTMYNNILI